MNDTQYYKKEVLQTKSEPVSEAKTYEAPKVKLSDNIQAFDKKVKVHTENPYSFNSVAKEKTDAPLTAVQSASQMIADPLYNQVGKILGVDNLHEWGQYYDKVYEIVELAKRKSGHTSSEDLSSWIYKQLNHAPSLGSKKINDVHIYLKMGGAPKADAKPKVVTKTVVKKVYVQPKQTTEQFVSKWMSKQFGGTI